MPLFFIKAGAPIVRVGRHFALLVHLYGGMIADAFRDVVDAVVVGNDYVKPLALSIAENEFPARVAAKIVLEVRKPLDESLCWVVHDLRF